MFTTKPESGEKITKLGVGAGDAKTPFTESWVRAFHRAAGNLCFQEPRPKCEQDGPVNYRRGPDDQRQHHL